ncbi:endonuclease/exonuclease/phosphatase family protein [Konateibacter massiliensis]|uniref:endonuclease/exonuclease/phosphatase family protein n=1 Tax=Konateibacter massiliensis TaxID=2002841 RepID=UPI000C144B27|nr:endonuclease/exonuclease/phosphatase family protein [Konateibacter massiliensis]
MKYIRGLFWNIKKKNLVIELAEACIENNIDIIALAESDNLDKQYFIEQLSRNGMKIEEQQILPKNKGIVLFSKNNLKVIPYKEEAYYNAYKIHEHKKKYLLIVTHFPSAMFKDEWARSQNAYELSKSIEILEQNCNNEEMQLHESEYSMLVVGDFNLQPFSDGVVSAYGFNATMDTAKAKTGKRTVDGVERKFYYNPMWHVMGKRDSTLGTYYYDSDQSNRSFFWYTFDQVLLRPDLIDNFVWEDFKIIDRIGNKVLIKNNKIDGKSFSDHLPIQFAIR